MEGIKENIKLARYTTYKIGGPARYFYIARNENQIAEAVSWARGQRIPYFILGGGSNILVSDNGFDGLVVRIKNLKFKIKNSTTEAGAGIDLPKLVETSIDNGLKGLEWASGIPGTFGGAIRGNAGAYAGEMKDIITSVRFLDEKGNIHTATNKECNFSYRDSIFKQNSNLIILSAILKFKKGNGEELKKFSKDTIELRASRHPLEHGTCGSVFKNIAVEAVPKRVFDKYPHLREAIKNDPFPIVPAACFIDETGLKQYQIGGAMVSDKHPNFIVNYKNAKADDVVMLISFIKQRITNSFGIAPEEEVQYVGF